MEFSRDLRDDVISGDITVSFRLWRRPKVKAGGRYPVGPAQIEIDSVELVPGYSPSTVNWYDAYHVVRAETVVDIWPIIPRGPGHHGLAGLAR